MSQKKPLSYLELNDKVISHTVIKDKQLLIPLINISNSNTTRLYKEGQVKNIPYINRLKSFSLSRALMKVKNQDKNDFIINTNKLNEINNILNSNKTTLRIKPISEFRDFGIEKLANNDFNFNSNIKPTKKFNKKLTKSLKPISNTNNSQSTALNKGSNLENKYFQDKKEAFLKNIKYAKNYSNNNNKVISSNFNKSISDSKIDNKQHKQQKTEVFINFSIKQTCSKNPCNFSNTSGKIPKYSTSINSKPNSKMNLVDIDINDHSIEEEQNTSVNLTENKNTFYNNNTWMGFNPLSQHSKLKSNPLLNKQLTSTVMNFNQMSKLKNNLINNKLNPTYYNLSFGIEESSTQYRKFFLPKTESQFIEIK